MILGLTLLCACSAESGHRSFIDWLRGPPKIPQPAPPPPTPLPQTTIAPQSPEVFVPPGWQEPPTIKRIPPGPHQKPVAHYPLDGNTVDVSEFTRNATNHGAVATTDRFGTQSGAMEFNGEGSYVLLPEGLVDPSGNEFSFSLWVYARARFAFSFPLYIGASTGEAIIDTRNGTFGFGVLFQDRTGQRVSTPVLENKFVHLAGIYRKGRNIELWLNGQRVAAETIPFKNLLNGTGEHSSAIGSYAPQQPNHARAYGITTWNGKIDDIRIYDRALTETEIKELAH